VLVVGGVAAGMSAASQIRRRHPKTRVTVFERGDYISYGACGLPYNIEDPEREIEDLVVLTAEHAREKRGIDLRLRHEAKELDADSGTLTVVDLDSGTETHESFDALVIAPVRAPYACRWMVSTCPESRCCAISPMAPRSRTL